MDKNIGQITQVIGPVVDIRFPAEHLPTLLTAIEIQKEGEPLIVEVAQHIGDDIVRCISMGPTDGLVRGMDCHNLGAPISVKVGKETLGRMFNVLGEPIDGLPAPETDVTQPIHREPPQFKDLKPEREIFETGIKVVDLMSLFQGR